MSRSSFYLVSKAALVCLLTLAPAFADDDAKSKQQSSDQKQSTEKWISDLSAKVQLTGEQTDKIRKKLNENESKITDTWQKFSEANAKAISLEATMVAAIEDAMTDEQKQQFRENGKSSDAQAKGQGKSQKADRQSQAASSQKHSDQDSKKDSKKDDRSKEQDADKVGNNASSQKDSGGKDSGDKNSGDKKSGSSDKQSNNDDSTYVYVTETIIVPLQQMVSDVEMDDAQRKRCDQACQHFHSKLHQAWNDVSRYHDELVQLEADKLRAVEGILNEGQLQKLKNDRKDNG